MIASWLLLTSIGAALFDSPTFLGVGRAHTTSIGGDFSKRSFKIYWNVPTFMCRQYGMYFEEVVPKYNIIQNVKDQFRGNQIAILYDPGAFPALLKDENGHLIRRNGGVPQLGNLTYHLNLFASHVVEQIKDASFSGLAVIDFESWRPIFRQNWASLAAYRDLSIRIEQQRNPWLSKRAAQLMATENFEKYGRLFMEESLRTAKNLRPLASWSYYAYPYCYNLTPSQPNAQCDSKVLGENDRLSWLFEEETVLLPSVYLRFELSPDDRIGLIRGRIREATRLARKTSPASDVFAYFWYKFQDRRDIFLNREDVRDGFEEAFDEGANGLVLWGSSMDVNSKAKCQKLMNYINDVLGPEAIRITQSYSEKDQLQPFYRIINDSALESKKGDDGLLSDSLPAA